MAATYLDYIGKTTSVYLGTTILAAGTIGNTLNIIVFLSLRTFRQSPCAFYLTIMSVVNVLQLISGLLGRIAISGFDIDLTQSSPVFCKLRFYVFPVSSLTSFTCLCLATIDQYFATCSRPRWQQWSNIKLARRLVAFFVAFWLVHDLPDFYFYEQVRTPGSDRLVCTSTSVMYTQYRLYFISMILTGFFPVVFNIVFGTLAYHNVRTMTYRTVPLVRRELDKQLTTMVLTQDVINVFTVLPYSTTTILSLTTDLTSNPETAAKFRLASLLAVYFYYIYFASPFFVYIIASERFRRQFTHVLVRIQPNRWQAKVAPTHQIESHFVRDTNEQ